MRYRWIFPIALLAIALATGCSHKSNDAALVTSIQSQMFADQQLKNANVQVTADKGEVTLAGTVPDDAAHLDAYKIASQTPGVTKVNDQITMDVAQAAPPSPASPPPPKPARVEKPARRESHRTKTHHKKHVPEQDQAEYADRNPAPPPEDTTQETPPPQQQDQNLPPSPQPVAAPAPPPPPPQPVPVEIAAGTTLTIRMIDGVDSSVNQPGEIFRASLENPIVSGDRVVVPKGADVYTRLVSSSSAGKFAGKSELHLELVKLDFRGKSYPLVSDTYSVTGDSRGKNTAEKVGGGAVIGAIIGAIAGGGKGAAIGAGVGGAGGGAYQAATHGKQVRIPSETKLDFQLDQPLTVYVMPRDASAN